MSALACECGAVTGERCDAAGATTTIEWMPRDLRASHDAAGNSGEWPHNGARHLRVTPECGARLVAQDGEWTRQVEVSS